jgi:hypothetical protein
MHRIVAACPACLALRKRADDKRAPGHLARGSRTIVAALPRPVLDALAERLAQRPHESAIADRPTSDEHESTIVDRPSSEAVAERHGDHEAQARLLAFVAEAGPASQRQARSAAGVAGRTADAVIRGLERDGLIQNVGTGRVRAWVTCPDAPGPLSPRKPADTCLGVPDTPVNGRGDDAGAIALEAAQTGTGPEFVGGECPDPSTCEYRGRHAAGSWSCEFNHPREQAS